jgi:hypothetical protein
MPRPQSAPNRLGIVAAIAQHTVRPPPRSPPFALEWGNRINQRQGSLIPTDRSVGTGAPVLAESNRQYRRLRSLHRRNS